MTALSIGEHLAITPGKVIYRNNLIELIQYAAVTEKTRPEPLLLIPPWVIKYHVLDLSPHNSMVRYLIDQGFTVFCISWRSPAHRDHPYKLDGYMHDGLFEAIAVIRTLMPNVPIHATGHCLGGTLLAIGAATLAQHQQNPLASVSLLSALIDIERPVAKTITDAMALMQANDLIWSEAIASRNLLNLLIDGESISDHYHIRGEPELLSCIHAPIFSVATLADVITPWMSMYQLHYLVNSELTFVLTSGGQGNGLLGSPQRANRVYQMMTQPIGGQRLTHQRWVELAPRYRGSWWRAWGSWLGAHSGEPSMPPSLGNGERGYPPLDDAPGQYVHER